MRSPVETDPSSHPGPLTTRPGVGVESGLGAESGVDSGCGPSGLHELPTPHHAVLAAGQGLHGLACPGGRGGACVGTRLPGGGAGL